MRFILMIFSIAVLFSSCTQDEEISSGEFKFSGKWMATQQFYSPGMGGSWHNLSLAEKFTIEFKADSSFAFSINFPKADSLFNKYSLSGSLIKMSSTLNSKTDTWSYFIDNPANPNLMAVSIFTCFEGCAYRFEKVQ